MAVSVEPKKWRARYQHSETGRLVEREIHEVGYQDAITEAQRLNKDIGYRFVLVGVGTSPSWRQAENNA